MGPRLSLVAVRAWPGLDDSARKIAQEDGSLKGAVDKLLWLKGEGGDAFGQMEALSDLRRGVAPKAGAWAFWEASAFFRHVGHLRDVWAGARGHVQAAVRGGLDIACQVVSEQNWLRLDIELEKYAFVLLSQAGIRDDDPCSILKGGSP